MKKLILVLYFCNVIPLYAQNPTPSTKENIIKLNLSSLILKNFSFQYERPVGPKTSVALGIRFQPYGSVPFQSWLKDQIDEPNIQVGQMKLGNFALTPEFRFYFKESMSGLYIAPYARYATFQAEAPVSYSGSGQNRTAFFNGSISSFSGGVLFGNQFQISSSFVLDWWILGAHIGGSWGQMDFASPLTPAEQQDLRTTLDDIDIPFFDIEHDIHANGGTVKAKGAWAGVRAFGVNVGWRF